MMKNETEFRLVNPPHVGAFVRGEIIDPVGLNIADAAGVLGVSRQALSNFVNEHTDLSPDMALRIEKAFGVKMDTLMRMQNSYDIAQARKREHEIDVAPYAELIANSASEKPVS